MNRPSSAGEGASRGSTKRATMKARASEGGEVAEGGGKEGREDEGDDEPVTTAARVLKRLEAWETRPPGPCDRYNSLFTRFLGWQTRRKECNGDSDCVFIGRSFTGFCIDKAAAGDDNEGGQGRGGDEDEEEDEDDFLFYDDEEELDEYEKEFPRSHDPEGAMVETELLQALVTIIREEGIEQPVRLLITVRRFIYLYIRPTRYIYIQFSSPQYLQEDFSAQIVHLYT